MPQFIHKCDAAEFFYTGALLFCVYVVSFNGNIYIKMYITYKPQNYVFFLGQRHKMTLNQLIVFNIMLSSP